MNGRGNGGWISKEDSDASVNTSCLLRADKHYSCAPGFVWCRVLCYAGGH